MSTDQPPQDKDSVDQLPVPEQLRQLLRAAGLWSIRAVRDAIKNQTLKGRPGIGEARAKTIENAIAKLDQRRKPWWRSRRFVVSSTVVTGLFVVAAAWGQPIVNRLVNPPIILPANRAEAQETPKVAPDATPSVNKTLHDRQPAKIVVAASFTAPKSELTEDQEKFAAEVTAAINDDKAWSACVTKYRGSFVFQRNPWTVTLNKVLDDVSVDPRQGIIVTVGPKVTAYCYIRPDKRYAGLETHKGDEITMKELLITEMTRKMAGTDKSYVELTLENCLLTF